LLADFSSIDFSFRRFIAGLPESMCDDQSSTNEKETQNSISVDLELARIIHEASAASVDTRL
jgi:hypothetical protein